MGINCLLVTEQEDGCHQVKTEDTGKAHNWSNVGPIVVIKHIGISLVFQFSDTHGNESVHSCILVKKLSLKTEKCFF